MSLINKLFSVKGILKNKVEGELPSTSNAYKTVFEVAWPSALECFLVALISAMDMIMVGRVGKEAISAVGICVQPKYICLAPIFALQTAAVVLIARRRGQKKPKDANDFLKLTLIISFFVSLIVCTLAYIFAKPILIFAGANNDYLDYAIDYFRIVLISLVPFCIGMVITASQKGAGNTRIALVTNLSANIINIIFNYLLIGGYFGFPALGVKGAAIATAIGNICSFFIASSTVFRKNGYLKLNFSVIENFHDKLHSISYIFKNSFGEQIILRAGFFMNTMVVANLGTAAFAAQNVVQNIMTISFSIGDGLQSANTSLVGKSLGEKRSDLATLYTRITMYFGFACSFVFFVVIFFLNKQLCLVFTNDLEVISLALLPMIILGFIIPIQIAQVIIIGSLRGAGDVRFVTFMMFLCVGIIRPLFSYIFVYSLGFGLIGSWISLCIDQFCRFFYSLYRFMSGKWVNIKV